MTKAFDIASKAAELVGGDRAINHGAKLENHQKIAEVWNGILIASGKRPIAPLDAHDIANLMEGLKIARRYCGAFNLDDYVDGAGYAACAGEIKAALIAQGAIDRSWGAAEAFAVQVVAAQAQASVPQTQGRHLHYLATPYSKYRLGPQAAFEAAAVIAARLLKRDVIVYSPIVHTHPVAVHGNFDLYDHGIWLPLDEVMMSRCDSILVAQLDGWEESKGIAHEIEFFKAAGKPVRYLDPGSLAVQPIRRCVEGVNGNDLAHNKTPSQQGGSSA